MITFFEACAKYPDVSPFVILKIDMQRRGFIMSQQAMGKINLERYPRALGSDPCAQQRALHRAGGNPARKENNHLIR